MRATPEAENCFGARQTFVLMSVVMRIAQVRVREGKVKVFLLFNVEVFPFFLTAGGDSAAVPLHAHGLVLYKPPLVRC